MQYFSLGATVLNTYRLSLLDKELVLKIFELTKIPNWLFSKKLFNIEIETESYLKDGTTNISFT